MTQPAPTGAPTIEFRGHTMTVREPDEAQYAILIEAERWMGRVERERAAIGDIPDGAPADHPGVVQLEQILNISKGHLGRVMAVLGSLFADDADWDYIRDGMADRTIGREEVFALPAMIIKACRDTAEPANRAERRKTTKASRAR